MKGVFLYLEKKIVKISWVLVSGTSRRWTQCRDVENVPLGHVATLQKDPYITSRRLKYTSREHRDVGHNVATLKIKLLYNVVTLKF